MRFILIPAMALALGATGALAAETLSPEAEAGLAAVKQFAKTDKIKFRKVKVGADGAVCGLASVGSDRDTEFLLNPDQTLWLNEDPSEPQSDFLYVSNIQRDTGRKAYQTWKACQAGK